MGNTKLGELLKQNDDLNTLFWKILKNLHEVDRVINFQTKYKNFKVLFDQIVSEESANVRENEEVPNSLFHLSSNIIVTDNSIVKVDDEVIIYRNHYNKYFEIKDTE